MSNNLSSNDLRTVWQNQTTELSPMTLETLRKKTQELRAKTRRTLLRGLVLPLLVAVIAGWVVVQLHIGPVLQGVFAFAIAWSLAGQYFLNRGMWAATLPGDAALSTGLESYRREVTRRHGLSSRFLLWSLGPIVLALGSVVGLLLSLAIREGIVRNMVPFLALLVAWMVGVFVIRMRDQRELRREIDLLREIERAN